MAKTTKIICKCGCGRERLVRVSDVKRGWGKFYDKSCKARHQEKRTGQYRNYLHKSHIDSDYRDVENDMHPFDPYSLGQE